MLKWAECDHPECAAPILPAASEADEFSAQFAVAVLAAALQILLRRGWTPAQLMAELKLTRCRFTTALYAEASRKLASDKGFWEKLETLYAAKARH